MYVSLRMQNNSDTAKFLNFADFNDQYVVLKTIFFKMCHGLSAMRVLLFNETLRKLEGFLLPFSYAIKGL